jgi:phosphate transport system substrate-binding protein
LTTRDLTAAQTDGREPPARQPTDTAAEPAQSLPYTKPNDPQARRRRWQIIGGAAGAAVLVLAVIIAAAAQGHDKAGTEAALFASPVAGGARPAAPPSVPDRPAAASPAPPALRLCGSNTVGAELAPALVDAFLKRKGAQAVARETAPEHHKLSAQLAGQPLVVDIRAEGTATAFEGLAAGSCDVGMASRSINDKEIRKLGDAGHGDLRSPATEHVIGLDGIAVIVHPNNKLTTLDRGQLHDVFTGKVADWSELGAAPGPITILARDDKSGTFDTFKNLVLGSDKLAAAAQRFAESDVLADKVASTPSAIGFIGLAYVRSAKAVSVGDSGAAPKLPTSFTVTTEEYMLSRRLYLYTTPTPRTPLATELVSFVLSAQGQAVVRETNFIDLSVALRDGDPCDARCPRDYAAMTARAQRISLDFRFRSGADEVDSRASRDLDRVVQFLRGYPNAKLLLLGFSDSAGIPIANVKLSQHRAATIARELETRGIHPAIVDGFGAAMPVASNATEADRQRNRRVEAWLELPRSTTR